MLQTILVPLDGSEFSEQALPLVCAIAKRAAAVVHLAVVHVPVSSSYIEGVAIVDPELDERGRSREQAYLLAVQQRLAADDIHAAESSVLDGPVAGTLSTYSTHIGADLVVMTTHGRAGLARFWLGSVADEFVRHSHIPVLLLHPSASKDAAAQPAVPVRHIVVALDGSPLAEQMLAPALALGTVFGADYTLMQVVDAIVVASSPLMIDQSERAYAALHQRQDDAKQYLERLAAPLRADGQHIATQVLVDPQPALAILRGAQELGSDVIALATHGNGGVRRLLLGSVADKVLRGADRPVLLYRPAAPLKPQPDTAA